MRQNGQIAIVVLLISAIVMTIGLSVSRRTVVETKISTDEEQLKQAFNTAESGIDYYLKTNKVGYTASDNSQANVQVEDVGVGQTIDLGGKVLANKTRLFWLASHTPTGGIDPNNFYGGTRLSLCLDTGFVGAIKIDYFYKVSGSTYEVWRSGFNIGGHTVTNYPNKILTSGCIDIDGNIPLLGGGELGYEPLLLAVRPIGMSTKMVLEGHGNFDFQSQGQNITSTGTVGNNVSQVVKEFSQYQVPTFMIDGLSADNVLSN